MALMDIGWFLLACVGLVVFGGLLVRSVLRIAQFLRMSEFVVAFLVMAIATSLPELFVGIQSALAGRPSLSLGTVIGSNIADLALIGGIVIILSRGITIKEKLLRRDAWMMVIIAAIPLILMVVGGELSRLDGILLLAGYAGYLTWLYLERSQDDNIGDHVQRWEAIFDVFLFIGAGFALYYTAEAVVRTGTLLATQLDLPAILIGLIFVALGTSLPELVTGTRSVIIRHPQIAIGDLVGAVIVNSLLVLGVTAVIAPITANLVLFFTSAAFMLFLVVLFAVMASRGRGFSWEEGVVLILFYVLFLIIELNVKEFFIA